MSNVTEGLSVVSSVNHRQVISSTDQKQTPATDELGGRSNQYPVFPDKISLSNFDISYSTIQRRNESTNQVASTIRQADKVMSEVGELIKEKRFEIGQYEKQYPPLQSESSEKVEFLNSLSSLKKQIDALTTLPDLKEVARIIGDPSKESGSIENEYGISPVRQHEIHSGPSGLNIASINSDANDSVVRQFGQDLARAEHKLERRQQALATDAKLLANELSIGESMVKTEKEAESKSQEVKQALIVMNDGANLIGEGSKLLESLN